MTELIIGAALDVPRELGPGLLESAYRRALAYEFKKQSISFEEQKSCAVQYKELVIDDAYRMDFFIASKVVVELKAIDAILPVHEVQVLTYLKSTGCRVGLLFNFRSSVLTRGGPRRLALRPRFDSSVLSVS